jgi:predicted aconitase
MLGGTQGRAVQKAMEILVALGNIYGAEEMVPVNSVQISGVSFDNLGEAGLKFLEEMADGGGKAKVLTTLYPAGMDIENWEIMGISQDFAADQKRVLNVFERMNIISTCTCTPYLVGNLPHFDEHIAWAESSAVCYANSVIGARTNREGGPSALAASLTGRTPSYGMHLNRNRNPDISVFVNCEITENIQFGALAIVLGRKFESLGRKPVPLIHGITQASLESLKSFCAGIATYAGNALFHMEGITPGFSSLNDPKECISVTREDIESAIACLNEPDTAEIDFFTLGCPHLSLHEIAMIADLIHGRKVKRTFWITTARTTKQIADSMGYTRTIENAGIVFATDTCCVVSPIQGRFGVMATDSAKACYYASSKNKFRTRLIPFSEVVNEALR